MIFREDLKDTPVYQLAVDKYKRHVKSDILIYSIILLVLGGIAYVVEYLKGNYSGIQDLIIFLFIMAVAETGIVFWHLFKLRNCFQIKEILIEDIKIEIDQHNTRNYYFVEERKKYIVYNSNLLHLCQQGKSYCFLCRGRHILELIQ